MSNNKKDSLSQDKKLHRTKIAATISIIISLILLIGFLSFQIFWNIFRFQFVKDGCAIVVDNQLAVGVEKIIRGEEANRILQERNPDYSDIEEGNEIALVKIKVKNITIWNAAPRYMEFDLYTAEYEWARDLLHKAYKPYEGEYKVLDTSKVFKPGETRDGVFFFEADKDKTLSNVKVFIFNKNHELNDIRTISLSRSLISTMDLFLLWTVLFFIFYFFISSYYLFKKRKEKRATLSESFLFYYLMRGWVFFYIIFIMMVLLYLTKMTWLAIFFVCFFIGIFFIQNLRLRKYLFLFYWLKKEDLTFITTEFKKRISWEPSEIDESTVRKSIFFKSYYNEIKILNNRTKESFRFTKEAVKVKHPYSDLKKIKTIINEIFNETEMDWIGYFSEIIYFNLFFMFLFIEYYSIFILLTFLS